MKSWSADLKTDLAAEVSTIAVCVKITRKDGTIMGFTHHDEDLLVAGVNYAASTSSVTSTALVAACDLSVNNLEVQGFLDSSAITEEDLLDGVYDHADFVLFIVNYENLAHGTGILAAGTLGEVSNQDGAYTVECRSLTQPLQQTVGDLFSPDCRANFCDYPSANGLWLCGLSEDDYLETGAVTNASGTHPYTHFTDSDRTEADDYYRYGTILWIGGENVGLEMEIQSFTSAGAFRLFEPMPNPIEVDDLYVILAGCDKQRSTCADTFDNAINFRGEPDLPGINKILDYGTGK